MPLPHLGFDLVKEVRIRRTGWRNPRSVERRAHAHFGRKAQRSDMLGHRAVLIAYVVLRQVPFGIDEGEGKLSSGHSIELSAL